MQSGPSRFTMTRQDWKELGNEKATLMRRWMLICLLFALGLALIACQQEEPETAFEDIPEGNATRGAQLFNQQFDSAASCSSCHAVSNDGRGAGPGLRAYRDRAGGRVDDEDAAEYTYWSILRPSRYVLRGYTNIMPDNYEEVLSEQDLADLIAYLLSL